MCTIIISFLLGTKNVISITKMLWCDSYSTSISTYRVLGGRCKGWSSSFQEEVSHIYAFRLDYSRISILYKTKMLVLHTLSQLSYVTNYKWLVVKCVWKQVVLVLLLLFLKTVLLSSYIYALLIYAPWYIIWSSKDGWGVWLIIMLLLVFVWLAYFLPTYFTIQLIFATIHVLHCTF